MNDKQFIEAYCRNCGTQRCEGIGSEWFEGCKYRWNHDSYDAAAEIERLNKKIIEMADELIKVAPCRRYEYRYGLYIGRFQPLHKGHCSVIKKALNECEKLILVIGSTQEVGTRKNPFSFEDRKRFIEKVFEKERDRITIIGLEDRPSIVNDSSWGEYVFNKVYQILDIKPEAVYAGEELINSHWYDTTDVVVKKINRGDINVSATEVREALYQNEYNKVKAYLPNELMEYYEFMKERIQTCYR